MNEELFYCYACERSAPPIVTKTKGTFLDKPHTYIRYKCSLCKDTSGTIRKFKCCPYCASTNIQEYEGDLQHGECIDCDGDWYDTTHYCD